MVCPVLKLYTLVLASPSRPSLFAAESPLCLLRVTVTFFSVPDCSILIVHPAAYGEYPEGALFSVRVYVPVGTGPKFITPFSSALTEEYARPQEFIKVNSPPRRGSSVPKSLLVSFRSGEVWSLILISEASFVLNSLPVDRSFIEYL